MNKKSFNLLQFIALNLLLSLCFGWLLGVWLDNLLNTGGFFAAYGFIVIIILIIVLASSFVAALIGWLLGEAVLKIYKKLKNKAVKK